MSWRRLSSIMLAFLILSFGIFSFILDYYTDKDREQLIELQREYWIALDTENFRLKHNREMPEYLKLTLAEIDSFIQERLKAKEKE